MQIQTKTVTVVRLECTEDEWATVRQLVAEGLTVVPTITPAMQGVAQAFRLNVAEPAAPVTVSMEDAPKPKSRRKSVPSA